MANLMDLDNATAPSLNSTGTSFSLELIQASGNATVAPLRLTPNSTASAPAMNIVTGGYASITSVVLTTVANTDYAIRVWVAGVPRWIPCFKDAGLVGTAAVG